MRNSETQKDISSIFLWQNHWRSGFKASSTGGKLVFGRNKITAVGNAFGMLVALVLLVFIFWYIIPALQNNRFLLLGCGLAVALILVITYYAISDNTMIICDKLQNRLTLTTPKWTYTLSLKNVQAITFLTAVMYSTYHDKKGRPSFLTQVCLTYPDQSAPIVRSCFCWANRSALEFIGRRLADYLQIPYMTRDLGSYEYPGKYYESAEYIFSQISTAIEDIETAQNKPDACDGK